MIRTCSKCGVSSDKFSLNSSWCRPCRAESERERRQKKGIKKRPVWPDPGPGLKICRRCEEALSLDCFSPSERGNKKVAAYCGPCCLSFFRQPREAVRSATARYRSKNPERYRASHRIHQARRRGLVVACASIPDEDLRRIYDEEWCSYCLKYVDRTGRTIDHVTPLSKGGKHSLENLVMACKPCNSSKSDKDLQEWLNGLPH